MKKTKETRIYLDEYVLQKDMRVRLPKEIIQNLKLKPGESFFEVYLDAKEQEIILTIKKG